MTRTSKMQQTTRLSPRKRHYRIIKKTGPKKDNLQKGYKEHTNAVPGELATTMFFPIIIS